MTTVCRPNGGFRLFQDCHFEESSTACPELVEGRNLNGCSKPTFSDYEHLDSSRSVGMTTLLRQVRDNRKNLRPNGGCST